jgi:hypothetical protein
VVACSDLKTARPDDRLQLRTVDGSFDERVSDWRERTSSAARSIAARKLYKGPYWSTVVSAVSQCRSTGWDARLWIASAGFGFLGESEIIAPYSATFARGHADSVWRRSSDGGRSPALAKWWRRLAHERFLERAIESEGQVIVVAGADYVTALRDDLDRLVIEAGDRVSIVSTSCAHQLALRYSAEISGALQCTLGVLNAKLLGTLADDADTHSFRRDAMQRWVDTNLGDARRPRPIRTPVTDAEVLRQIGQMRSAEPALSRSRALRGLRSHGFACSQERFALLWNSAIRSGLGIAQLGQCRGGQ